MATIIILSFTTGLCAGYALTYLFIKSYRAAAIGAVGVLLNLGLLLYTLSLQGVL